MKQGALWMTYSYVVGFGAQGLYFVILARSLSPAEYGEWAGAQAVAIFFATFSGLGSGNLLVVETSRSPGKFGVALGHALRSMSVTAVPLISLAVLAGLLVSPGLAQLAIFIGFAEIIGNKMVDLAAQCAQANRAIHLAAHFNVLMALSRLSVLATAVFLFRLRVTGFGWSILYSVVSVLFGLCALVIVIRKFGAPRRGRLVSSELSRGFFFSLGMASRIIYNDADKYLLNFFGQVSTSGFYSAAYRLTNFAFAPAQALVYSSNVSLYREGAKGYRAMWLFLKPLVRLELALSIATAVVTALAAPLLPVLLGPRYVHSVPMLQVLALMLPFQALHYLIGDALMGAGRQSTRSLAQLLVAIISIAANYLLIPGFGWLASALISVATAAALAALTLGIFVVGAGRELRLGPAGS